MTMMLQWRKGALHAATSTRIRHSITASFQNILHLPHGSFTRPVLQPASQHLSHQCYFSSTSRKLQQKQQQPQERQEGYKEVKNIGKSKKTISRNQEFRNIEIPPHVLAHIREIGVGIHPRSNKKEKMDRITGQVHTDRIDPFGPDQKHKRPNVDPNDKYAASNEPKTTLRERLSILEPPRPFGKRSFPVKIVGELSKADQSLPLFMEDVPQHTIPQIAICGRSNVGKSTLLNVLLYSDLSLQAVQAQKEREESKGKGQRGRKKLEVRLPKGVKASTSKKPGETRTITFYQLGSPHPELKEKDLRLVLVDLPGYGFAYRDKQEKENFRGMMMSYLTGSLPGQADLEKGSLHRILLLIDARHGMKQVDADFLEMIQSALLTNQENSRNMKTTKQFGKSYWQLPPIQLVLTKCDLVSQVDLARRVVQVRQQLSDALIREPPPMPVLYCSSKTNNGILEIQKQLGHLAVTTDGLKKEKKTITWDSKPPRPLWQDPEEERKKLRAKKRTQKKNATKSARAVVDMPRRPARNLKRAGILKGRGRR